MSAEVTGPDKLVHRNAISRELASRAQLWSRNGIRFLFEIRREENEKEVHRIKSFYSFSRKSRDSFIETREDLPRTCCESREKVDVPRRRGCRSIDELGLRRSRLLREVRNSRRAQAEAELLSPRRGSRGRGTEASNIASRRIAVDLSRIK